MESRRGHQSLGAGLTCQCQLAAEHGCLKTGPLEERQALLTIKSYLQPHDLNLEGSIKACYFIHILYMAVCLCT